MANPKKTKTTDVACPRCSKIAGKLIVHGQPDQPRFNGVMGVVSARSVQIGPVLYNFRLECRHCGHSFDYDAPSHEAEPEPSQGQEPSQSQGQE